MILDEIVRSTGERLRHLDQLVDPDPPLPPRRSLAAAIRTSSGRHAVIAEVKYASPSRGRIHEGCTPRSDRPRVRRRRGGRGPLGADRTHLFRGGSTRYLVRVRRAVSVPVLRKDFIIDERQLGETRALGADAVLLIARVLGGIASRVRRRALALGLEPLVEVHDRDEMERALATNATLIGINNRNLETMTIDLSTTVRLAGGGPRRQEDRGLGERHHVALRRPEPLPAL